MPAGPDAGAWMIRPSFSSPASRPCTNPAMSRVLGPLVRSRGLGWAWRHWPATILIARYAHLACWRMPPVPGVRDHHADRRAESAERWLGVLLDASSGIADRFRSSHCQKGCPRQPCGIEPGPAARDWLAGRQGPRTGIPPLPWRPSPAACLACGWQGRLAISWPSPSPARDQAQRLVLAQYWCGCDRGLGPGLADVAP
jgi:hypothetical protein